MRLGHLFQRCAIDLIHLGVAAIFLAGLDLDGVGCAHAAKHVRDQLEQGQIERGFGMQRHRRPEGHCPFGLEVLGQRGWVDDCVCALPFCAAGRAAGAGRLRSRLRLVLWPYQTDMQRNLAV